MVSSGIRVGAWDYLRWGNIVPIEQDGKIVRTRMMVYAGEEDSYVTFINSVSIPRTYRMDKRTERNQER